MIAVYARASTDEQRLSVADQVIRCTGYARARGLGPIEAFTDIGVSGKTPFGDRPAGARLLAAEPLHLVALRLDRLFRSVADCVQSLPAWEAADIGVHLVDMGGQSVDTTSATGRFFLATLAAFAELERDLISERTRAALSHMKARGERVGHIPYGFELGPDGLLQDCAQERAVIRYASQMRSRGWSWQRIALRLNERALLARDGKPWHGKRLTRCAQRKTPALM